MCCNISVGLWGSTSEITLIGHALTLQFSADWSLLGLAVIKQRVRLWLWPLVLTLHLLLLLVKRVPSWALLAGLGLLPLIHKGHLMGFVLEQLWCRLCSLEIRLSGLRVEATIQRLNCPELLKFVWFDWAERALGKLVVGLLVKVIVLALMHVLVSQPYLLAHYSLRLLVIALLNNPLLRPL